MAIISCAVLRLRFSPPAAGTGQGGGPALTINPDHSVRAGQDMQNNM